MGDEYLRRVGCLQPLEKGDPMKGFKNFLMQGELIVIAVGLVVALAFSTLIKAFTDNVVTPIINSASGTKGTTLGWTVNGQRINVGAFISAVIYFVIFMAVVYYALVVPYRTYMAKKGTTVFGPPAATKSCPRCQAGDLAPAATRCPHCTSDVPAAA
jgi:large conductance mechanosensitive channel